MKKRIFMPCIIVALFCLLFALSSCTAPKPFDVRVDENSTQGVIYGTAFFDFEPQSVSLYFADEEKEILPYFSEICKLDIGPRCDRFDFDGLVLPPNASYILVKGDKGALYTYKIEEKYLLPKNMVSFGLLSDVHFNKYYDENGGDIADYALTLALDFFEKSGASYTFVAGDLSNNGEESAYTRFNEIIKQYDFKTYAVTGNHDAEAVKNGTWLKLMNTDILENSEISDIGDNGLDFVFVPQGAKTTGDVFVFLSQVRWEYGSKVKSTILDEAQLEWLEGVFNKYKNNRVHLFFHTFLCGPDGQKHTGVGNIRNGYYGYTYDSPFTYGARDELVFRRLLKENKNVIFYSGHSHWEFDMVIYGEWANFSNFGGEYGYMLHIPSVTEPRTLGQYDINRTSLAGVKSQGWLCYIFDGGLVYLPIDFTTGTVLTPYMEIINK